MKSLAVGLSRGLTERAAAVTQAGYLASSAPQELRRPRLQSRRSPGRPRQPAVSDSGGRCALSRPHHGAAEGQLAALDQGGTDLASTTGPGWAAELIAAGQGGVVPLLAPAPERRSEVAGCPRYARCGNTRRRGSEPVSGDWGGAKGKLSAGTESGVSLKLSPGRVRCRLLTKGRIR